LKTSICTIGYATWRAVRNPNIRILIANATATNASHFLRTIKAYFETNALLRWLWPEAIPDTSKVKWTDTEIELARSVPYPESTIEAIGVGGTVVSRHYDLIIEDDLIAPEDGTVTAEMVKKCIDWHQYATSLFVDPSRGEQNVIGTRWLYDDFIAYIMQRESWFLPALYKGGYGLWKERFSDDTLDRILEQFGPRKFSCAYLNDPVHEDTRAFDPAWFRYYDRVPEPYHCVTAIDPAISQKKHGDYSAIVTVAAGYTRASADGPWEQVRYIVDARRGRWGIDELIDQVFEVNRLWRPRRVGLETVMFQKALLWPFREAMRRENVNLPIVELRPSSQVTKEGRIQALHEFFANGSLWLNQRHAELLDELRGWPAVTHDDMLDALAYAMQMLVYPTMGEQDQLRSPFSLEEILSGLRKRADVERGPWVFHGEGAAMPVAWVQVPQTVQEISEALAAQRQQDAEDRR